MHNTESLQLPGEQWAQIAGFPLYEVSSLGRIKSLVGRKPSIRRQAKKVSGGRIYRMIVLCGDGQHQGFHTHRLVATAFLPNPLGLPVVHHIDNNPSNNAASNLQWATQLENIGEAIKLHGNWLLGVKHEGKPIYMIHPETGEHTRFRSIRDAIDHLRGLITANGGIPPHAQGMMGNVCRARDRNKIAYGFRWFASLKTYAKAEQPKRSAKAKKERICYYPATGG